MLTHVLLCRVCVNCNSEIKMGDNEPEPRTISVPELAKILGISLGGAYAAAKRGDIPVVQIGRHKLVSRAAVKRLLGEDA